MALPRPILLALVGLLLVGVAFFATRVGREDSDAAPSADVAPAPEGDTAPAPQDTPAKPKQQNSTANEDATAKPDTTAKQDATAKPDVKRAEKTKPAKTKAVTGPATVGTTPATRPAFRVKHALKMNPVVVIFFRQRGADDDATAAAVASLRGHRKLGLMTLPVGQAARYAATLGGVTVSRAPSVVILSRKRQPLLIEGFVDSSTLAQAVADVR